MLQQFSPSFGWLPSKQTTQIAKPLGYEPANIRQMRVD